MAESNKKRVIVINGPIASKKSEMANMLEIFFENSKTLKMSIETVSKYYDIVQRKDDENYEKFLVERCETIMTELENYFKDDNKNDALIIVTDILAIVGVLAKQKNSPCLTSEVKSQLNKMEKVYRKFLREKAYHIHFSTLD